MSDDAQRNAVQEALLGDTSGSELEEPRLSSAQLCGVDETQRLQTVKKPTKNLGNCNDRPQCKTWYDTVIGILANSIALRYEHEKTAKKPQFSTEDKCVSYMHDQIDPEIKNAENGFINLRIKDSSTGEMKTIKENVSLNLQKKFDDLTGCESNLVQVGYRKIAKNEYQELTLQDFPDIIMISINRAEQKIKLGFTTSGHEDRALMHEKNLCTEIQLLSAFTKALEQKYTKLVKELRIWKLRRKWLKKRQSKIERERIRKEKEHKESEDDEPGYYEANAQDDDTNMSEFSRLQANTVTWSEVMND